LNRLVPTTARNFVSLCYHYLRPQSGDPYPRLLGTRADDFRAHIRFLQQSFRIMGPQEIGSDSGAAASDGRCGLLFTFDDGLSDHLTAGEILAEEGVRGLFFIPTCVLADGLPANPIVIHYGTAIYGVERFLQAYRNSLEENQLPVDRYDVPYLQGSSDPWAAIRSIKQRTKYDLGYRNARSVLLSVYRQLLCAENPGILSGMHLDATGVGKLIDMGHGIGSHSHTHLSVAASDLQDEAFEAEIIRPRHYLEECFGIRVASMSYPFGGHNDCFTEDELRPVESGYELAFTVERKLNTAMTSRFALGRYMPVSTDSAESIANMLGRMVAAGGTPI
jgi:peptidoglycan/xylan/chitin deacetylase (PgdA/CDA1 family)